MSKTAFLLAGQGSFRPGMFAAETGDPAVTEVLDTADAVAAEFGRAGVRAALTDPGAPPAAELARTDPFGLQLAVFAATVGEYHRASRTGAPDVIVGHSLGELAALTVAGAFDVADAARLVCHRSVALERSVAGPGGMLSVDLPADRAAHVLAAVGDRRSGVAVLNAPERTAVAGPDDTLATVVRVAEALGVRTTRLPAPYAYHSPGMALAAEDFTRAATGIRQRPLRLPVFSPLLGGYLTDDVDLTALLARHLTSTVDFLGAVRTLHAHGMRIVVECGRTGLGKLVTASVPDVTVAGATAPAVPAPREPGPAIHEPAASEPAPALPAVEDVTERLRVLYATSLQYPLEAVEPDADLESELGIDSLKRAEMLGRVGAEFGLPESVNDGRFLAHTTLAELAGMVVTTLESTPAPR